MVDRNAFTPLYIQIYGLLKKELVHFPIGTNIPPERTLCEMYDVDRVTIRKALTLLSDEGYIERHQGRGTKVVCHEEKTVGTVLFLLSQGRKMKDRIGEPFYARSYDALEEQLQKINKRLIYSKVLPTDDISELCKNLEAQAVILACTPDDPILDRCKALDIPIVCYNTCIDGFPSVTVDNDSAASVSAKYLLDLGHRNIGFIRVPGYVNSEKRLDRYRIELNNLQVPESDLKIVDGDWTEDGGYRAAYSLLSDPDRKITAIFGGNDSMAIGALRAAKELGLRVPEDISIIGFDGVFHSSISSPSLTTHQVDLNLMAESTCMILNHILINRNLKDIKVLVPANFIIKDSTASVK